MRIKRASTHPTSHRLNTLFLMKSFAIPATLAALAMAATQAAAAPTQASDMHCHNVQGPKKLSILTTGPRHFESRSGVAIHKSSDGRYLLHDGENSDDRFEFFQCDSPPKGFKASSKNVSRGQVRSEKHPDKCLTVGGVDNRPRYNYEPELPDNQEEGDFDTKNGVLSLQPCSEDPRLQLWELIPDSNSIFYIGSEGDMLRSKVSSTYHHRVMYSFPVMNPEKAPGAPAMVPICSSLNN